MSLELFSKREIKIKETDQNYRIRCVKEEIVERKKKGNSSTKKINQDDKIREGVEQKGEDSVSAKEISLIL